MDEGRSEITTSFVVNNEQKKENLASAKAEFPDKHRIAQNLALQLTCHVPTNLKNVL